MALMLNPLVRLFWSNKSMRNYQAEKKLVRDYYKALDRANVDGITEVLELFIGGNYLWRGFHPFNEQFGAEAVSEIFWKPFRRAFQHMQRRMDVFFAGSNEIDDHRSVWVVSMGHLMGLFDQEWLGMPPTGKIACLRYCEFNKVENGKIVETAMFFDIPHVMYQVGLNPFPNQNGVHLIQPGPITHDGLCYEEQSNDKGCKTLETINKMITDIGQWDSGLSLEEELAHTWHDDMIWWGPAGIGATYTIKRYAKQHAGPFRASFSDRSKTTHICRMAEGYYGGFFGWPNFSATLTEDFMGIPATAKSGEMRVIDIYRRESDKLAENWIFIDFLHFWNQQGVDILSRVKETLR